MSKEKPDIEELLSKLMKRAREEKRVPRKSNFNTEKANDVAIDILHAFISEFMNQISISIISGGNKPAAELATTISASIGAIAESLLFLRMFVRDMGQDLGRDQSALDHGDMLVKRSFDDVYKDPLISKAVLNIFQEVKALGESRAADARGEKKH